MRLGFVRFAEQARVDRQAVEDKAVAAIVSRKLLQCVVRLLGLAQLVQGIGKGEPHGGAIEMFSAADENTSRFDSLCVVLQPGKNRDRGDE